MFKISTSSGANGPDAGASHIRNTGNQNVVITIITRNFLVSKAMSGLSVEVNTGVKIHTLKVIRQHAGEG